jgi:hypothetical protein
MFPEMVHPTYAVLAEETGHCGVPTAFGTNDKSSDDFRKNVYWTDPFAPAGSK